MNKVAGWRNNIILMAIMALATILLTWRLSFLCFWGDEINTITFINRGLSYIVNDVVEYPPLYLLIAFFWSSWFGTSEASLRTISLLPSIVSVFMCYKLGDLLIDRKVGLLSSFILATSPFFVLFSRMARYYPLAMLLSLVSLYLFIRILQEDKFSSYIYYVGTSVALLYTHYILLSVIIAENLILIFLWRKHRHLLKRWILSQVFIVLLFSPYLIRLPANTAINAAYISAELSQSLQGVLVKVLYTAYAFSLGETVSPLNLWVVLPAFVLYLVILLKGIKVIRREKTRLLTISLGLLFPLAFTIIITSTVSTFDQTSHIPTLIMFACPLYYIVVATGILSFKRKSVKAILIFCLTAISTYSLTNYFTKQQYNNPHWAIPWKQIAQDMRTDFRAGDLIIDSDNTFEYYKDGLPTVDFYQAKEETILNPHCRRFWLVFRDRGQRNIVDMNRDILKDAEQRGFRLVEQKEYVRLDERDIILKEKLLGREVSKYNVVVYLYERE